MIANDAREGCADFVEPAYPENDWFFRVLDWLSARMQARAHYPAIAADLINSPSPQPHPNTLCPACGHQLRTGYLPRGLIVVWCAMGRCPSVAANEGAWASSLREATERLEYNIEGEEVLADLEAK